MTSSPTLTPGSPGTFPRVVDSTMLTCYDACATRFYYEYILQLAARGISPDLHAGGAFAYGLEHVRRGLWQYGEPTDIALLRGTRKFTEYWGAEYDPPDTFKGETHPKSYMNTLGALWDYFREYSPATDLIKPLMKNDAEPAVEFTFALPTRIIHPDTGDPIIYGGRADLLGYFDDVLVLLDDKTTKSIGANWATQWKMRAQFMGYTYAARQYGFPIKYMIVRGVAIQKTQYKHVQLPLSFPNWQIERWWEQMHEKLSRMVTNYVQNSWGLSYGDACSSYGGCEKLELCTSRDPSAWFGDYKRRLWNPLQADPTKPPEEELAP